MSTSAVKRAPALHTFECNTGAFALSGELSFHGRELHAYWLPVVVQKLKSLLNTFDLLRFFTYSAHLSQIHFSHP